MDEVLSAKVISLVLMQLLTLGAGLLPIRLITSLKNAGSRTQSRSKFIISLLNCFAGGVFLATTLLHLLPEVGEIVDEIIQEANIESSFPIAEFIVSVGFFLIMLLEHLVMSLQHKGHGSESFTSPLLQESTASESNPQSNRYGSISEGHRDHENKDTKSKLASRHSCEKTLMANIEANEENCVHVIHPTHHERHHKNTEIQGIRSLILLLALSLHTIFEGLAIGLQSTSQQVWTLFMAVSIHKVIMAFTMGIQFMTVYEKKCRVILFMVIFSLMSPLGIGIGITVTSAVESEFAVAVSSGILQGIATGTFVYVTFFEVLQKEVGQDHSLLKVFVVILGYVLVALLALFLPHE